MDTINRLQFRHHEEIFETREDALKYICKTLPREGGEGLAEPGSPYTRSLFAEPTILRYKNTEEEGACNDGCNKGPHIILVIGSQTNDDDRKPEENKYCIIDIDKTEDEIKNLEEEIEKAIKSLTIIALNSDTLNLYAEKTEDGTLVSGDVKTAETHVFEGVVKENNLMVVPTGDEGGPEGLFIYVDLTYDEATETFTFIVTNGDGTLKKQAVKLPNNYLVSGEYKKEDESIHLHMKNGDEVIVDCEQLIDEWKVEGDASMTPIVLTREEVGPDEDHHHTEPWQDILRGDVRIADFIGTNILKKTSDGRYLYVDGKATNIIYYYNGELSNVSEQLDKLNKIKISADNDNIIWNRTDGFFATSKLEYISNKNKLVFTTSNVSGGTVSKEIQLNSVELFQNVYYDRNTEELVITYKDNEGNLKVIRIPISDMFDEWDVLNDAHSVKLVKSPHHVSGKDILTADVNISSMENNILEEMGEGNVHALFVKGTSDNIKYNDTTVEGALDDLATKDTEHDGRLDAIDDEIGDGFGPRATIKDAIDALSANTLASLKHVKNEDKSIDVVEKDGVEGKEAVIKVNLSGNEPYNTLRLERDGLYNFIDLRYDSDTNKLTFVRSDNNSTENVEKEIQLNSAPFDIRYDKDREVLIITYHTSEGDKTVEIDFHDLIHDEWTVRDTETVELHKELSVSGSDVLTADVKICHHEDNAIEVHNDGLYVHSYSGEIVDLGSRIDTVSGDVITEKVRAEEAENNLANSIASERDRAIAAENSLHNEIEAERRRAEAADTELYNAIQDEKRRAEAADTQLEVLIGDERTRAISAETALRNDFVSGDTELDHKIVNLETTLDSRIDVTENRLQAAIDSEKSRAEAADNLLDGKISTEKERAMTVEGELRNAIAAETVAREAADDTLEEAIEAATYHFDDTNTVDFTVAADKTVTAAVKIANADNNIIKLPTSGAEGIYASVEMKYDKLSNILSFKTSADDTWNDYSLLGATVIDSIEYDSTERIITIKYTDGTGTQREVHIGVEDLFNDWDIANPSSGSAIELTKEIGAAGEKDKLYGKVLLTNLPDNAVQIVNNGLYVSNSAATAVECVSGKTDAIYKTLFGGIAPGGCGEGIEYKSDPLSCVISAATSFMEADKMMAYQICEILEMWVSGMTCTTTSEWVDDGANKKMMVDVRPSYGKATDMTSDDLYIIDLTGKTIEHGVTEFTDTNALRIVCLEDGGGVIPDISAKQNGIYLSNVWDCGKYYQESTEADEMEEVSADGYNVNYFTDEDTSASGFNYMNNVRIGDDTLC